MSVMTAFNTASPRPCATLAATAIAAPPSRTPTKTISLIVAPQTAPRTNRPATNQYIYPFPAGAIASDRPSLLVWRPSDAASPLKYRGCWRRAIADEDRPAITKRRHAQNLPFCTERKQNGDQSRPFSRFGHRLAILVLKSTERT